VSPDPEGFAMLAYLPEIVSAALAAATFAAVFARGR
jgi:hypothetical protein